uniref:Oxidoreductase AflY n=1 Tax=Kwoniella dejecticola CBS 10117 TaxID=1296121 RepID=A0A1A6A5X6_9TREE|nr:uncharacterized protein I303_04797 [Kwoniella dejecticola CBS 10117]OBR85461.1 hypothetical protein I303_04797 [Kwoniella dejecticola CBS 10117]
MTSISEKYPPSTAEPSKLFRYPGVTWESTQAVRGVLEENDRGYDIYESARFAHNHFPHSALTRYALGASPQLLRDTWAHDKPHLVPLDPNDPKRKHEEVKDVPEQIDQTNWGDRKNVGMKGAYARYLTFFHQEIAKYGSVETMNKYVFSPSANWQTWKTPEGEEKEGPMMIDRLVGGVFHPFIHVGFGLEFNDKVTLAEGLAEAAIHSDELNHPVLTPEDIPDTEDCLTPNCAREPRLGRSLLEIYSILLHSDKLSPAPYDESQTINDRIKFASSGDKARLLRELAEEWSLTDAELSDDKDGWERKFEEVAILVTLLACGTGRKGKDLKIDFFLMHTLTSSIFIPSYMPVLSIPNRRLLLRAYVLVLLNTALARGRPSIDPQLIMSYDAFPVPPGSEKLMKPNKGDVIGRPEDKEGRNPWLGIVESSLAYTDSHVPKAIRSLLHFATLYGATEPGCFIGSYLTGGQTHETIPGMANVDGSVFVRGAGAIMQQMGWTREGQEKGEWEFSPVGYDEVWK